MREAAGGGGGGGTRDTESKTRTPHKDVGKYLYLICGFLCMLQHANAIELFDKLLVVGPSMDGEHLQ